MITLVLLAAAAYWYWSGPYQAQKNPGLEQRLKENGEKMRDCIRAQNYKIGATGVGEGSPEEVCAEKFNLYLQDGRWHNNEPDSD